MLLEQDVLVGVALERRVEVDEVNTVVGDVLPQKGQFVPEVELIAPRPPSRCPLVSVPSYGTFTIIRHGSWLLSSEEPRIARPRDPSAELRNYGPRRWRIMAEDPNRPAISETLGNVVVTD